MDFDEPGLEELIESNLHSEMKKILDESDSENIIAQSSVPSEVVTLSSETGSHFSKNKSEKINNGAAATPEPRVEGISSNTDENDHKVAEMFLQANPDQQQECHAGFSGHFSVERFPACPTDDHLIAESLVQKTEQSDLSNLEWLTTVDVQRELRADPAFPMSCGGSFHPTQSQPLPAAGGLLTSSGNGKPFPVLASGQGPVVSSLALKPDNRSQSRFTPIQPHPVSEVSQHHRYAPHGSHQRTLLPLSDRLGPHRYGNPRSFHQGYHPYPPPPYGPSPSGYGRETYPHTHHRHTHNQKVYPKPVYSYSCLIAMSLQKSKNGCLPVSDIYSFMMENFPYFKTAPDGWKNSVRHNLSLNKCFEKVEKPNGTQRKGCLWALNPAKISKMEEEVQKWKRKDPDAIRRSMSNPDEFDREMEDLRRADEEAARRRMLSLSTHGLSMATPPHGFSPGFARQHSLNQTPQGPPHHMMSPGPPTGPHMHPSGTASLPSTPQHYPNQQTSPYRHAWTPGNHNTGRGGYPSQSGNHAHHSSALHGHPPRQLFDFPSDCPGPFPIGSQDLCSTPVGGNLPTRECSGNLLGQPLASPNSSATSSSTPSGTTASFGSLAGVLGGSGHDFSDLELDPSISDIYTLHSSVWDETAASLAIPEAVSESSLAPPNPFNEAVLPPNGAHLPPESAQPNFQIVGQTEAPEQAQDCPGVFPQRFRGNASYLAASGNNKAVMMH